MEGPFQPVQQAQYQTGYQPPNQIPHQGSYQGPHPSPYPGPYPPQNQAPNQPPYPGFYQVPVQFQSHPPNSAPIRAPPSPPASRQKYYRPVATGTPVLLLFFLFSVLFVGGLEGILQRGVPIDLEALMPSQPPQHMLSNNTSSSSINSGNLKGYEKILSQSKPSVPSLSCIGIEIIVSVTDIEQCSTVPSRTSVSCAVTTTQSTYEKPIYNKAIPTMPCYICAIQSLGIEVDGWITAATTHCASCGQTNLATIYPCSTCEGIVLSGTPRWETTPTALPKVYATYGRHTHGHDEPARPTNTAKG